MISHLFYDVSKYSYILIRTARLLHNCVELQSLMEKKVHITTVVAGNLFDLAKGFGIRDYSRVQYDAHKHNFRAIGSRETNPLAIFTNNSSMMTAWPSGRLLFLQLITLFVLVLGVVLTFAGLFTSSWQVAELVQPYQIHLHGLYEDCVRGERSLNNYAYVCVYKDYGSRNPRDMLQHHHGEEWRLATLILIALAAFLGVCSLLFACCSICCRCAIIFWDIILVIACLTNAVGLVVFVRNANDVENKFLLAVTETVQQYFGSSFWLAVAGAVFYFVTLSLAIGTTCVQFNNFCGVWSNPGQQEAQNKQFDDRMINQKYSGCNGIPSKPAVYRISTTSTPHKQTSDFVSAGDFSTWHANSTPTASKRSTIV